MKCVWKKLMIVVMLFSFITVFVGCGKEERKSDEKGDISVSGVVSDDNEKNQVEEQNDQGSGGVKLAKDTDKELAPYLIRAQAHGADFYGYVDIRTGEFVIAPQFTDGSDSSFRDAGWAYVQFPDKSEMIINTKGEYLVAPEDFSEGTSPRPQ